MHCIVMMVLFHRCDEILEEYKIENYYSDILNFYLQVSNTFIFSVHNSCLQERMEAASLFASEEMEEEAKKESMKTLMPVEVPNVSEEEEQQTPKVVAPTPEQIIAIKVFCLLQYKQSTVFFS